MCLIGIDAQKKTANQSDYTRQKIWIRVEANGLTLVLDPQRHTFL